MGLALKPDTPFVVVYDLLTPGQTNTEWGFPFGSCHACDGFFRKSCSRLIRAGHLLRSQGQNMDRENLNKVLSTVEGPISQGCPVLQEV